MFTVALALTAVMAAPVLLAPTQRLFGSARTFAAADPNRDPLVVISQLRSGHVPPPYLQPLTDLPARALARVIDPVAAFNVMVLSSFPLAAAAAYLLARHLTRSHRASLVAGLAYAFLPFHVAHAAHHVHVAQTQWLPLYLLALWRCADSPRPARAGALLLALCGMALSNFYGALIAAVIGPAALLAHAIGSRSWVSRGGQRGLALTTLTLAAGGAAGGGALLWFAPQVLLQPEAYAFPRSDLFLHAARWWSYLVPPVDSPVAGALARRIWQGSSVEGALLEQQVSVGWALLALAAVPLWRFAVGDRAAAGVRAAPVLAAVAAMAVVCSLSPERSVGGATFVRPSALLYEIAPMFRAYARFGLVVGLMASVLAGAGASWLRQSPHPAARAAAAVLLTMAAVEHAPLPWRSRDVLPTAAHRWLTQQPGPLRVLDCEAAAALAGAPVPRIGHELTLLGTGVDDCAEPGIGAKLSAAGYTHVIVRTESTFGRWLATQPLPARLSRGPRLDDGAILIVDPRPPSLHVAAVVGFYAREYGAEGTWRWMGRTGALRIVAAETAPDVVLTMRLRSFPGDRRVRWLLDARPIAESGVTPEWKDIEVSLGQLAAGTHTLTIASDAPAVVAGDRLPNGDARAIAVAVGEWTLEGPR